MRTGSIGSCAKTEMRLTPCVLVTLLPRTANHIEGGKEGYTDVTVVHCADSEEKE